MIYTLKELKRELKDAGYKTRTHLGGMDKPLRFLEVLDQNNEFIGGSGANVYTGGHIKEHQIVFDILKKYRQRTYDKDNIKVLF